MSLDAMVWLVAGVGLGVGLSLMLLIVYAGLERLRLGRRLKRARVLRTVPPPRAEGVPEPVEPTVAVTSIRPETIEKATPAAPAAIARIVPRNGSPAKSTGPAGTIGTEPVRVAPARRERIAGSEPAVTRAGPVPEVEPAPGNDTSPRRKVEAVPKAEPVAKATPVADAAVAQQVEGSAKPAVAPRPEGARPAPAAVTAAMPPATAAPKSVEALFAEAFARDRLVAPGDEGGKPE